MKITGVSRCLVISVLVIICLYCSLGFASQLTSESNVYYRTEYMKIPVNIDGKDYELEAKLFRPIDDEPHPLIIMTTGRNGHFPSRNLKEVESYNIAGAFLCNDMDLQVVEETIEKTLAFKLKF